MDNTNNNFVGAIVPKKGFKDFIVCDLNFKVDEFHQYLMEKKDHVQQNNGWMKIQILKSKNDPEKFYAKFNDYLPTPKVTSADHSPDRQEASDDLPF